MYVHCGVKTIYMKNFAHFFSFLEFASTFLNPKPEKGDLKTQWTFVIVVVIGNNALKLFSNIPKVFITNSSSSSSSSCQ